MDDLLSVINIATENKPPVGEPCNFCGWCCLTEVCVVGQGVSGSAILPCSLLREEDGKHLCGLSDSLSDVLGLGTGCCAETQNEVIARITNTP